MIRTSQRIEHVAYVVEVQVRPGQEERICSLRPDSSRVQTQVPGRLFGDLAYVFIYDPVSQLDAYSARDCTG